jgi:hypothetical protein
MHGNILLSFLLCDFKGMSPPSITSSKGSQALQKRNQGWMSINTRIEQESPLVTHPCPRCVKGMGGGGGEQTVLQLQ